MVIEDWVVYKLCLLNINLEFLNNGAQINYVLFRNNELNCLRISN